MHSQSSNKLRLEAGSSLWGESKLDGAMWHCSWLQWLVNSAGSSAYASLLTNYPDCKVVAVIGWELPNAVVILQRTNGYPNTLWYIHED